MNLGWGDTNLQSTALTNASHFSFADRQGQPGEVEAELSQLSHWGPKAGHCPSLAAVFSSANWVGKDWWTTFSH